MKWNSVGHKDKNTLDCPELRWRSGGNVDPVNARDLLCVPLPDENQGAWSRSWAHSTISMSNNNTAQSKCTIFFWHSWQYPNSFSFMLLCCSFSGDIQIKIKDSMNLEAWTLINSFQPVSIQLILRVWKAPKTHTLPQRTQPWPLCKHMKQVCIQNHDSNLFAQKLSLWVGLI